MVIWWLSIQVSHSVHISILMCDNRTIPIILFCVHLHSYFKSESRCRLRHWRHSFIDWSFVLPIFCTIKCQRWTCYCYATRTARTKKRIWIRDSKPPVNALNNSTFFFCSSIEENLQKLSSHSLFALRGNRLVICCGNVGFYSSPGIQLRLYIVLWWVK